MATTTFLEPGTDATQDFSFWTTTAGNITSDTGQSHTGPRSIKMFTSSPATTATMTSLTGILSDAGTQISYYYMTSVIPAGAIVILQIRNSVPAAVISLQLNPSGNIVNAPNGATSATGSTVIAINTWYRICISYFVTNSTTYTCKIYINGVLDSTTNAGTLTNVGTDRIFPVCNAGLGINQSNWLDDVYVATGGASSGSQPDTGDIRVTAKRPFSNGTTNGYTTQIGSGGSGYGSGHAPQVNEKPLSTTNGWSMVGAGSAITEEYNIESSSVGDVNISGNALVDYIGWLYGSSLVGETAQIIVNGVSSNISLTNTNTMFVKGAGSTTYPAGTGTDIGEITATSLTTVSLYECGIIFAFLPSSSVSTIGIMNLKTGWWGDL